MNYVLLTLLPLACQQSPTYVCQTGTCVNPCFPASATVQTQHRGTLRVGDVRPGDRVLSVDWAGRFVFEVRTRNACGA